MPNVATLSVKLRPYNVTFDFKSESGATLRSVSSGKNQSGWHVRAIYRNGTLVCALSDIAGMAVVVHAVGDSFKGGKRVTFNNLAQAAEYVITTF